MKVTKRNGNVVIYDDEKIVRSILRANAAVLGEELTESIAAFITGEAFSRLTNEEDLISTLDIRQCVGELLKEQGFPETARAYLEYKK